MLTVAGPDGSPANFACPHSAQGPARQLLTAYLAKAVGSQGRRHRGLAAAQSYEGGQAGGLVQVTVFYQCSVEDVWYYVPAMGEYVYAWRTVDDCWVTEVRLGEGGGAPAGSWGTASGTPTSAPSAPVTVRLNADTLCTAVTSDMPVTRFTSDGTLHLGVPSPLNDKAIQDSMLALFRDSYGPLDAPLPQLDRRELGAILVWNPLARTMRFERIAGNNSHCHFEMPRTDTLEVNGVIVGFVHTHPMRDGEVFDCPYTETENEVANNEARGGRSETDWQGVWDRNLPTFTVDPDRMWRLDPSQVANRVNNPHRWMRPQSGGCATRAAL